MLDWLHAELLKKKDAVKFSQEGNDNVKKGIYYYNYYGTTYVLSHE
jgi:hypothetical protein